MAARHLLLLWLALAAAQCGGASIWGWLLPSWAGGGDAGDGSGSARLAHAPGVDVPEVHFETKSVEDKFIDAVQRYEGRVSDLDACQHKVVLRIQKSCSSLSEEDLAKLSVNLLNCQAAVEGRQQFPCTERMSIRDCTQQMDADMWNAYHLMNNRARSVCYAARQEQFRAAAEMTVDRLFEATRQQVSAVDSLKSKQERLGQLTRGTLERQGALLRQQHGLRQLVGSNLRDLLREKRLAAAGHRELARMTEDVRRRLDAANAQLDSQTTEQRANHEQLVADLTAIQRQAAEVWAQVERSTREVLDYQRSAARQYRHSLERLRKINETVDYLLQMVETTRARLDARLGWVARLAGDAGDGVERLVCAAQHLLVLLGGALAAAFVGAPPACRVVLALLVPANVAIVLQKGPSAALDVSAEVAIVGLVAVGVVRRLVPTRLWTRSSTPLPSPLKLTGTVKDPLRESTPETHFSRALDESRSSSVSGSRESLVRSSAGALPLATSLRYRSTAYSPPTPSVSSRGSVALLRWLSLPTRRYPAFQMPAFRAVTSGSRPSLRRTAVRNPRN